MKRLLIILAFLLIPLHSHALSLSDLKIQIRQRINDRPDPKVHYSDAILLKFLNEAQRDVVNRTWCLQKTTTDSLAVRTTYYALPTDLIAIQEFNFVEAATGRTRQLEEKSERALYQDNPDYERQRGTPYYYFVRHSTYGATQLQYGINPVPSSTTATGTAYIDYYNQAADLSANTDVPFDGFRHLYPYHDTLIYYVVGHIKMFQGDITGATTYLTLYDNEVKMMVDRLGRLPNYSPSFQAGSSK